MPDDTLRSNRVVKSALLVTPQDKAALESVLNNGGELAKIVIQEADAGFTGQTIYTIEVYIGEKNEGIRITRKINDEKSTFEEQGTYKDRFSLVEHLVCAQRTLIDQIQLSDAHGHLIQGYITTLIAFIDNM